MNQEQTINLHMEIAKVADKDFANKLRLIADLVEIKGIGRSAACELVDKADKEATKTCATYFDVTI